MNAMIAYPQDAEERIDRVSVVGAYSEAAHKINFDRPQDNHHVHVWVHLFAHEDGSISDLRTPRDTLQHHLHFLNYPNKFKLKPSQTQLNLKRKGNSQFTPHGLPF